MVPGIDTQYRYGDRGSGQPKGRPSWVGWVLPGFLASVAFLGIMTFSCWVAPTYKVWHQHMTGKAELARAEYNRQIAVVESEAKLRAATNYADADIARAKGTAEANHIIGSSITDSYLRWYYIDGLHQQSDKTFVYVPTEAMIPITEAGRLSGLSVPK